MEERRLDIVLKSLNINDEVSLFNQSDKLMFRIDIMKLLVLKEEILPEYDSYYVTYINFWGSGSTSMIVYKKEW